MRCSNHILKNWNTMIKAKVTADIKKGQKHTGTKIKLILFPDKNACDHRK